ncbi:uncharacterized protein LOC144436257 [Glandiceps talaboti]
MVSRLLVLLYLYLRCGGSDGSTFEDFCYHPYTLEQNSEERHHSLVDLDYTLEIPGEQLDHRTSINSTEYRVFTSDDCILDVYVWTGFVYNYYYAQPNDLGLCCNAYSDEAVAEKGLENLFSSPNVEGDITMSGSIIRIGTGYNDKPISFSDIPHPLPQQWFIRGGIVRFQFSQFPMKTNTNVKCWLYYGPVIGIYTELSAPFGKLKPVGCQSGMYGGECDNKCICKNGATCHSFNGACLCRKGWSGVDCNTVHPVIEVTQSPMPAFVNDTLSLTCYTYGITVYTLTWTKDDVTLEEKSNDQPVHLEGDHLEYVSQHVSVTDSGIYQCITSDIEGVIHSTNIHVHITWAQKISTSPKSTIVYAGKDVILTCHIENLVGQVTWYKGNGALLRYDVMSNDSTPTESSSLRHSFVGDKSSGVFDMEVSNVQIEDEGIYYCEAGARQRQSQTQSQLAELAVLEPPRDLFIMDVDILNNCTFVGGKPIAIRCEATDGNPPATMSWYVNGERIKVNVDTSIEASNRRGLYHTKGRITITPTYKDIGAILTCEANSEALNYHHQVSVKLNDVTYTPVVLVLASPSKAREGDDVIVTCMANANPPTILQYDWTINGDIQTDHNNTLSLERVSTKLNSASVKCRAYNSLGFGEGSTLLQVAADESRRTRITLISTIIPVGLLLILLPVVTYRYRREIRIWKFRLCGNCAFIDNESWEYDAFVCYRCGTEAMSLEEVFVINEMVPRLENDHRFKLCIHSRDFPPGAAITDNILGAIQRSSRTILILTKAFVESEWCRFEYEKAQEEMFKTGAKVIPILFEDVTTLQNLDPSIRSLLNAVPYLKWPGDNALDLDIDRFWRSLINLMPNERNDCDSNGIVLTIANSGDKDYMI